jgi:nicotinamidase/pyrazinamidase
MPGTNPPAISATVLCDVDTQNDFLLPAGALYVPGAEKLIPTFGRIVELAQQHAIPVISTADAHTDRDPEFLVWPPHCVAGTLGQAKIPGTLLAGAVTVANREGPLPDSLDDAPQIIVEKQTVDMFQTATLRPVLALRPARRYAVFGVVTEICVWHLVRGLRASGLAVDIITDAIASLDPDGKGRASLDEMAALGARLITCAEFAASV